MMKHLVLRSWWLVLVFVSGCFSPQFQDGQIMCGPNKECPPGLECFGTVCRAEDPGIDASTTFPLTVTLGGNSMGTVTSNPAGINCGTDCIEQFMSGTMVTLTASPNTGSTFMGWSGACSGTGTCTITVSTAINVTANFALDNSLMVVLAGNGSGLVSSNPAGINCGTSCSHQFPTNTMVTLTALTATGSTFDGWSGGGCTGTGTCVVTTDAAKMVTATFTLTQHALTVTPAGNGTGMVTSTPAGISCGADCSESYPYNTMVTLAAMPTTGSTFIGWSGGGCTGTGTCTVTMTAATTVTATFTLTTHALSVTKTGAGAGTITSTPAGINCGANCTASFDYNTMVTLSATPSAGSTFAGWSGAGCSGTASCTVTMTMAATVNAMFTLNSYALTVTKSGNGSGVVTGTGISCGADCNELYPYNTMVTLTATPAAGVTFTGWSGACTGTGACNVTVTAATDVTATFTLTTHVLTVTRNGTGTGSVAGVGIACGADCTETVDYNTTITLNATPAAGSTFDGWTGGGCSGTGSCQTTITMATTVTATFTLSTHVLTVQKAGTGAGTVTSAPAGISCGTDCNEVYNYNTSVTLTATPSAGSTFGGWSGGGCSGLSLMCTTTVTAAATVTATFTLTTQTLTVIATGGNGNGNVSSSPAGINCGNGGSDCTEPYNYGTLVTLTAAPASGSSFTMWSGGGCTGNGTCVVTMDAAKTVTATFTLGSQALSVTKQGTGSGTVTSNPMGINCGATCSGSFTVGSTVVLTAAPAAGSTFTGWSGGGCTGTGTCSVVIPAGGVSVSATFTLSIHTLSVTKAGTGTGTVTSNPTGINCGANCNANYNYGTSVTLTATPAANATFSGWTGGGCSGTGTCTVSVTAATTVQAGFALIQHNLNIKPVGVGTGVVTSNPIGINCGGDCDELYNDGTMVMLTATPDAGNTFAGWSGDCSGTMPMCIVTMSGDMSVAVDFEPRQYTLTVSNTPATGGDVFSTTDPGIDCGTDCTEAYDYNTFVSLKPSERSGYTFTGWTGACTGNGSCDLTMDNDKVVSANYVITTHLMTVNRGGNGAGSVSSSPAGISCGADCTESYNEGTLVTLTAAPSTGSTFTGWSGALGCTAGISCQVTMDSAKNVTATFTLQTFTLAVTRSGAGSGTVTSSPSGINCGGTPSVCSRNFDYNLMVTLTASPAPGTAFGGWSGACTNVTGTCTVTMTAARSVNALFTIIPANYVFVTSTLQTGMIGGLSGADSICQMRATSVSLPGTYRAWLSTSTVDAASRLGSARGWIRTDGKPVADRVSDITSGHMFYPIKLDEAGTSVGDGYIPTATGGNGLRAGFGGTCSDWTSTTGNAAAGFASHHGTGFTVYTSVNCTTASRLYCFGIDNQAVVAPPAVTARRAFVSSTWQPGGGLASADAQCSTDATAAGLTGSYKALLATTTASAISRFSTGTGTLPWARLDNTLILPTAGALASTTLSYVDATPNSNAANNVWYSGNPYTWTGADNLHSVGTQTCANWTANTSASVARAGWNGHTKVTEWRGGYANIGCDQTGFALVCLQE
jgi:uncharacterized repeat protein (TIGR02543 family)